MSNATNGPPTKNPQALRDEWLARLKKLTTDVRGWAERAGWKTREIDKAMKDSVLGEYRAPALLLQRDTVEAILNPVSRFVPGADGAVDLYLMPGYDDVASLYYSNGVWQVHYVFGNDSAVAKGRDAKALPLEEATVVGVLDQLAAHAA